MQVASESTQELWYLRQRASSSWHAALTARPCCVPPRPASGPPPCSRCCCKNRKRLRPWGRSLGVYGLRSVLSSGVWSARCNHVGMFGDKNQPLLQVPSLGTLEHGQQRTPLQPVLCACSPPLCVRKNVCMHVRAYVHVCECARVCVGVCMCVHACA